MGKAKGFLTYDEVNEHMPEGIVSPIRWTTGCRLLSGEGIEIVDSSSKVEVADAEAPDETRTSEDAETSRGGRRGRGGGGRRRLRDATIRCACTCARWGRSRCSRARARSRSPSASRTASGACCRSCSTRRSRSRRSSTWATSCAQQKIRVKEVVKDDDEEDAEFDEQWHIERVCKVIDKVRRLWKEQEKVAEKLDAKPSEPTRKRYKSQIDELKQEILDALRDAPQQEADRQDRR